MNESVKCRECGEMILREEAIEYEKEFVCQDCFDEEYVICSDCGCIVPIAETTVINRSRRTERRVCNTCRQEYFHCDVCGEYVTESEIWASDDERSICYNCNSDYCTCEDCGTILHYNDARYSSYDDNYYCEECYEEHDASYIEEYSYKPAPVFLGYTEDNLNLGVELEVDRGTNMHQTTKDLTESFQDIYLKHDGSLGRCGFEIVSHPATLDYHMNELGWDKIMDILYQIQNLLNVSMGDISLISTEEFLSMIVVMTLLIRLMVQLTHYKAYLFSMKKKTEPISVYGNKKGCERNGFINFNNNLGISRYGKITLKSIH